MWLLMASSFHFKIIEMTFRSSSRYQQCQTWNLCKPGLQNAAGPFDLKILARSHIAEKYHPHNAPGTLTYWAIQDFCKPQQRLQKYKKKKLFEK